MRLKSLFFSILLLILFLEILVGFPINLGEFISDSDSSVIGNGNNKEQFKDVQDSSLGKGGGISLSDSRSLSAEQVMNGVHLVESQKSGQRDWELYAEKAEAYEKKGLWNLIEIRILFYNEKGLQFTVKGREASVHLETKDMLISGNVITQSSNGYIFLTNSLEYLSGSRILQTRDPVKMYRSQKEDEGFTLKGKGMKLIVAQSQMSILSDVRGEIYLVEKQKAILSSQRAQFSNENLSAIFTGEVKMQYDENTIQTSEARFLADPKGGFKALEMKGNVLLQDQLKSAKADHIHFDPIENRWILTGNPKLIQGSDEMSGDRILLLEGGDRVFVEGMSARVEKEKGNEKGK